MSCNYFTLKMLLTYYLYNLLEINTYMNLVLTLLKYVVFLLLLYINIKHDEDRRI